MTIDANLIEGFKLGLAFGVVVGMGLSACGAYLYVKLMDQLGQQTLRRYHDGS